MDESTKMMIDRLDQDAREREQRYRTEMLEQNRLFKQEVKESEERILDTVQEMKVDFKDLKSNFKNFKTEMKSDWQDVKEDSRKIRNTVIALTVSVILGVASMSIAIFLAR